MNIIQKPTPHQTTGREGRRVNKVLIHWIGSGTADSAVRWFNNPNSKVSAHYLIDDTTIYQFVDEANTAWHAGDWVANTESIGIEHYATPNRPMTDATYNTSAKLVKDICSRYNISIDKDHILPHKKFKNTQCPGTIDIDRIIELANDGDECEKRIQVMRANMERFLDERDVARDQRDKAIEDAENKEEELKKAQRKYDRDMKAKDKMFNGIISDRDTEIADLKSEIIKLKSQGGVIPMNKELIWESIKAPLRQALLALYAFAINQVLVFITNLIGFEFTSEQKVQIIGYGTPLVWSIISAMDKLIHKIGKEKGKEGLFGIKGLSGF